MGAELPAGRSDGPESPPAGASRARRRDRAYDRSLNPTWNTLRFRDLWTEGERLFVEFAFRHPREMLAKWGHAYRIFCQPLENYGPLFVSLCAVAHRVGSGLDLAGIVGQLRRGTLPEPQYVMSGTHPFLSEHKTHTRFTPTTLYTLRWLDPFVLMLNVLGI